MATLRRPLYVQDILFDVFPYLDPDQSRGAEASQARRTLLASALTCRDFTQPALNILWKTLPSDAPLTALLLALNIVQAQSDTGARPYHVSRPRSDVLQPWTSLITTNPLRILASTLTGNISGNAQFAYARSR